MTRLYQVPRRFRTVRYAVRIAALVAVISCGDSTSPSGSSDFVVAVRVVQVAEPVLGESPDHSPTISCEVQLEALGHGAGSVAWVGATFRFYPGGDLSAPFDTALAPISEIRQSWGHARIGGGDTETAGWRFYASIPFTVAIDFHYRSGSGPIQTVPTISIPCRPSTPPSANPPTITGVTITPASGEIEPGEVITVNYTAAGASGLWETVVRLSGGCDTTRFFTEVLQTTVTHSAQIQLPSGCNLGIGLQVTVFAIDAELRQDERQPATQLVVVDHQPPAVSMLFFPPGSGGRSEEYARGVFFVGDTLHFKLFAEDNNDLRFLIWDVQAFGLRDSVTAGGSLGTTEVRIPIPSEWNGPFQLRLLARDGAGQVGTRISEPDSLIIYPDNPLPTNSRHIDGEIRDVAIDVKRGRLYLLQPNQRRVRIVESATLEPLGSILLPGYATGFDLTAGGDSLILALQDLGAIGVVNLASPKAGVAIVPVLSLSASDQDWPSSLRTTEAENIFINLQGSASPGYQVIEKNLTSGAERFLPNVNTGGHIPDVIERSSDHRVLLFGDGGSLVQRYDSERDVFGPMAPLLASSDVVSLDSTGQRIAVGFRVYDASLQLIRQVRSTFSATYAPPSFLSADGLSLYYDDGVYGLVRTRVSDGDFVDRTRLPFNPGGYRMSPDGRLLVGFDNLIGASNSSIETVVLH